MNKHLPLSKDIKNIIIKYTLPKINELLRTEMNVSIFYYILMIGEYLDNKFVYGNNGYAEFGVNFNRVKYKRVKGVIGLYWTLRLKTDL
jgi:hypothetical protein